MIKADILEWIEYFVFDAKEDYFQEKLLQAIWNEQLLKEDLETAAGQVLRVVHRGVWNVESGPDFHDGAICIDGQVLRGSIEIHHQPEQWEQHNHHTNEAYAQVILHVVWRNPHGHREYPLGVPLLVLEDLLSKPLPEIMDTINLAAYPYARQVPPGELASAIARMSDDFLRDLFQSYGIARILHKAQTLCEEIVAVGMEEAVYRRLLDAMGYKSNREGFALLAEAVPVAKLERQEDEAALALLLGAGGLLPDPSQQPVLPAHREWLQRLWAAWWPQCSGHRPVKWSRQRMRPYNAPERRVLAAWLILRRHRYRLGEGLLAIMGRELPPAQVMRALREALAPGDDEAYRDFYDFCRVLDKPATLLGASRVNDLMVNLAVPLYFAHCFLVQQPERCPYGRDVLKALPRLQSNRLLEEAAHCLFVPPGRSQQVVQNACAQQGLIKLYREWSAV